MAFGISALGALAIGVGTTAVAGAYSANKASKAQNRATDAAGVMAGEQLALDRETLDFYKQQYADSKPLQESQARAATEVSNAQLASMRQNDAISNDYWNYQKNTFRPLEGGIVADAQNFNSEARQNEAAGKAIADVEQQFGNEAAQQQRSLARMGVNPNSGKFAAMSNQMSMAQAAARAGAGTAARNNVELQGYARKMDAANMGRGLASSQATSAGVAMNAGDNAVANAGAPINTMNSMTSTMGQGYGMASNGMASAHNMINQANQNTANMWGNTASSLFGAAGTMAGTYFANKPK